MPDQTTQSLELPLHDVSKPLPAQEQLALLFHLANTTPPPRPHPADSSPYSPHEMNRAYLACKQITRYHSKSFFFSTLFLPPDKRRAIHALYAFCRASDDTVDLATGNPAYALAEWVSHVRMHPSPDNPILMAWNDTRLRYNLSWAIIDELLAGVAMDLTITRYATFADLWLYCYRVASVVGLLSIGILGTEPRAKPYAIKLGVALQLTNILRDVGEDARRGRVYLPEEDLERFGVTTDDILSERYTSRFCNVMKFEIERAHRLYNESWNGIALLPRDSRLAVGVASRVYRGILDKIVLATYDSFRQRAYLTLSEKLLLLPRTWYAVHQVGKG